MTNLGLMSYPISLVPKWSNLLSHLRQIAHALFSLMLTLILLHKEQKNKINY